MTIRSGYNSNSNSSLNISGFYRGIVKSVGSGVISLVIPNLSGPTTVYEDIKYVGFLPAVDDYVWVSFIEGKAKNPLAFSLDTVSTGDITAVTAGTALSGGGSSGDVTLNFAPSELSSVTVAADDKVVIADTSDSDNPKHVTAQSIADLAPQGDITGVTAGLGIGGGGTTGTVEVTFAPSELSSVTVATDDKVVIADTSDSDNPKHVTAQSIADLASVSPAGSDTQVQFNNSGSFGASSNMVFDGTNLDIAGLKIGGTAVTSTAAELNLLDGITAGTVSASLAVIVDSNKDISGFRNISTTGTVTVGDGSDSAPAYTFGSDTDTGMYLYGTNQLGFTVGGDSIAYFKEGAGSGYGGLIINDTSETIADGGIRIGQWYTSTYSGIFMDGHTDNEYMMISSGASTFVSCGAGGSLYLRGAENNSTTQIEIDAGNDDIIIGSASTGTTFAGFIEVLNEIQCGSGSVSDPSYTFDSDGDTGIYHTTNVIRFTTGGSQRGLFSSAGLYAITAVTTGGYDARIDSSTGYFEKITSSIKYKEDVVNMPKSEWEKVYQLEPRSFNWKNDGSVNIGPNGRADFGFIAEEVNEIAPMLTIWGRENYADSDDELGIGNESELMIDGVEYAKVTTYLVAAIKDLKARIEVLEG